MKPVKILFLLLAVLLAGASCGSDDDDDSKTSYNNADLEGLWVANGWGSSIAGVDDEISTLIGNSIKYMYGENPTQIDGKYRAYYFDGDERGVQGVSSSTGLLDESGRTNIAYNVNKDILVINDGLEGAFVPFELVDDKTQLIFVYDLTLPYQNKAFMQELLNEAGLTHINVNTIKVKEVKCRMSYLKVADGI